MAAELESFVTANSIADVEESFAKLLRVTELEELRGQGKCLFDKLKETLAPKLNFKQKKLFTELDARFNRGQTLLKSVRKSTCDGVKSQSALVSGAGPVGLRVALEAQMLGFQVTVVEKRNDFSRANILTFWKETMDDMLSLAARTYCPNIVTAGDVRHLGTREIQLVLLKDLLLFGGEVRYGHEIVGLIPPSKTGGKWQGRFRPYEKGRRKAESMQKAENAAEVFGGEDAREAAEAALSFAQAKDASAFTQTSNKSDLFERNDVDPSFISGADKYDSNEVHVSFDTYFMAEGAWSDSKKRLGFDMRIKQRNPTFGFVVNLKYDRERAQERQMKSFLKHALSTEWPLQNSLVLGEFLEYLKGETHFFAMVCSLENPMAKPEAKAKVEETIASGSVTPETEAILRFQQTRLGLLEMGIIKEKLHRSKILLPENVDAAKLEEMGRIIATDCGLPADTPLCDTNPVQLFDFSALGRSELAAKILRGDGEVVDGSAGEAELAAAVQNTATVYPVGDSLQEPLWTSGLGVNRGFHGGLNAVWSALLAREVGLKEAMEDVAKGHELMSKMQWGDGRLAGGGSGSSGVKAGTEWTADPRSRLPWTEARGSGGYRAK